jgi:pantothenate kinase
MLYSIIIFQLIIVCILQLSLAITIHDNNLSMRSNNMYEHLAFELQQRRRAHFDDNDCDRKEQQQQQRQYWVAIAGGPGSGKTTIAHEVSECLNRMEPNCSIVIPMDGFHYAKSRLKQLDPSGLLLQQRGSPWTFDAELCLQLLSDAKEKEYGSFPSYDRNISDPVWERIHLLPEHKFVLIEGLYLLWKDDTRWEPLQKLWDEKWFVKVPSDAIQRQRLIQRSLRTWYQSKAEIWGEGEVGAAARVDQNDVPNMNLVAACEAYADIVIINN